MTTPAKRAPDDGIGSTQPAKTQSTPEPSAILSHPAEASASSRAVEHAEKPPAPVEILKRPVAEKTTNSGRHVAPTVAAAVPPPPQLSLNYGYFSRGCDAEIFGKNAEFGSAEQQANSQQSDDYEYDDYGNGYQCENGPPHVIPPIDTASPLPTVCDYAPHMGFIPAPYGGFPGYAMAAHATPASFYISAKHFDNLVADVRELRKTYLEINREIAAMHYEMRCELDDVNRYCAGIKDRLSRMCGHLGLDVPAGADQAKRQTIWARNGILVRQQQQQHGNAEISKLSPAPASEPTTAPSASAPNVTNSRETANADPTDEEEKDAAVPAESDRTPRDVPRPGRGLTYPMPDAPKFVPLRHRQAANQALKQQTGQATSSVPSHSLPKPDPWKTHPTFDPRTSTRDLEAARMVVEIMLARGGDVSMDAIATALERPPGSDPARVARPATPIERKECLRGLAVVLLWLGSVNCVASVRGGVLWKLRISDAEQVTYNMNMGLPRRR